MRRLAFLLALGCFISSPGHAFVTLRRTPPDDAALRWSAARHDAIGGAGLSDGIQVAIEPEFAEKLAVAVTGAAEPADVADVEGALVAAFRAWESPVLRFEITLDGAAERGELLGSEIDVFLVPETDEVFTDNNYFGVTYTESSPVADRLLTNGTVSSGPAITGADIYINETILAGVAPALTRPQQLAALQRLLMHEIGHALGFHHPNEFPESNYDLDGDPLNPMLIDPDDPTAGLQLSSNVNASSVVSNRPASFAALLFTTLQNDERGGRDVLYPLHEPECPGDCDASRVVAVNELVQSVNIALDRTVVATCRSVDRDRDERVRVDELVSAVRNALTGCPADRRIVALEATTHFETSLPLDITRGTIRLEVLPTWVADDDVSLVDVGALQSFAPRIQLLKNGAFLRFVAVGADGNEQEIAARIDDWSSTDRHTISATWTPSSATLYVDGVEMGELALTQPIAHASGAPVQIGDAASGVTLENVELFGRP